MGNHTPAPWKVFYAKYNGELILGVGEDNGQGIIASNGSFWGDDQEAKANAEHVVKCVNVHDELLEVLEECMVEIKKSFPNVYEAEMHGIGKTFITRMKAAIKKAKVEI